MNENVVRYTPSQPLAAAAFLAIIADGRRLVSSLGPRTGGHELSEDTLARAKAHAETFRVRLVPGPDRRTGEIQGVLVADGEGVLPRKWPLGRVTDIQHARERAIWLLKELQIVPSLPRRVEVAPAVREAA